MQARLTKYNDQMTNSLTGLHDDDDNDGNIAMQATGYQFFLPTPFVC